MLKPFFRFFSVETHLSTGSADGVEVFVESTVACNQVKDGSIAHLVSGADGSDYGKAVRNCFASFGVSLHVQ